MPQSDRSAGTDLWLGLMCGTSVDGIDAALMDLGPHGQPRVHAAQTFALDPDLREEVLALSQTETRVSPERIARLDHALGCAFAQAALYLLDIHAVSSDAVVAIGSHGQTLRHAPTGSMPFTWQIGDPNLIAERTGITTVADFRRRDVAAGGQGAPLMPAFHRALLADRDGDAVVLNLGGIANVSLLPHHGPVTGFDTGPANGLMDAWTARHIGEAFDREGAFAASGRVDADLLARLLTDPYFDLPPPKSTGRDHFHLEWLDRLLGSSIHRPQDVQATLLELTACSIATAVKARLPDARTVYVCGGGVHNHHLMQRLTDCLHPMQVLTTDALGIDPDFVEAAGFAWLARQTLLGLSGNLPEVTGARGARVLGAIHPA